MYRKRLHKSFQQSLLDNPVPKFAYDKKSKRIKALPPPLVLAQYVPPVPKPKPRTKKPVAIPRNIRIKIDPGIEAFKSKIEEFYSKEAKSKFDKRKNFNVVITEKGKALKNYAKSFEVSIVAKEDIAQQLFNTRSDVFQLLESELYRYRGIKVEVTLKVLMKKKMKMVI